MTKEQYEDQKRDVIKQYGEPTYNEDYSPKKPLNESAKKLADIHEQYRKFNLANAVKTKQDNLKAVADFVAKRPQLSNKKAIPIYLTPDDLKGFTEQEAKIIEIYFDDYFKKDKQIAQEAGCTTQAVTVLKRKSTFLWLQNTLMNSTLKIESWHNLREHSWTDPKINLRLAEHYEHIKPEEKDLNINKPIEDKNALEMLRRLGDKLTE